MRWMWRQSQGRLASLTVWRVDHAARDIAQLVHRATSLLLEQSAGVSSVPRKFVAARLHRREALVVPWRGVVVLRELVPRRALGCSELDLVHGSGVSGARSCAVLLGSVGCEIMKPIELGEA